MELSPSSSSSRAVHKHLWVILSHAHQRELLYFQAPHKDKLQPLNFSLLYRQMSRQRRQSNQIRQHTINARVSKGKLNTNKPSTYSARCPAVYILQSRQNKLHSQKPQNSKSLWIISCLQIWLLVHSKNPFPSLFPAVTDTRHCPTCSTRASFCFLFRRSPFMATFLPPDTIHKVYQACQFQLSRCPPPHP